MVAKDLQYHIIMTNNNSVTLSIIIPVYNVERYIRACLNSVFHQDAHSLSYEVIVVNDGTPDTSMAIVEEFARQHDNLAVINQENQGLSCARNAGLEIAKGEYVWFVDSDDVIVKDALLSIEALLLQNTPDIFCFDIFVQKEGEDGKKCQSLFTKQRFRRYYGEQKEAAFYYRKMPIGIVQEFLFKQKFLNRNSGTRFTPHIYHEDVDFLVRCYTCAESIMPIQQALYVYRVRETGSITTTFNIKRFHDMKQILDGFMKKAEETSSSKASAIYYDATFLLCHGMLTSEYRSQPAYITFMQENRQALKNAMRYAFWHSLSSYFTLGKVAKYLMYAV